MGCDLAGDAYGFNTGMDRQARTQLIQDLEDRFQRLTCLLYDTSVDPADLDAEIAPYLAGDVRFTDPWQSAAGRERYRRGAAGFHRMLRFRFEVYQVNVRLDAAGRH